jgi:hypothetical protein
MWDFKLKKTRIIFIASIVWLWISYGIISTDIGRKSWGFHDVETMVYLTFISPVLIYWIGIPLYRWIMKGK